MVVWLSAGQRVDANAGSMKKDDEGPSSSYDTGDFRASPLRQRGGAHAYSAEDDLSRVMV